MAKGDREAEGVLPESETSLLPVLAKSNLALSLMTDVRPTASEKDLGRSLLWETGLLMPIPGTCLAVWPLPTSNILKSLMLDVERDAPVLPDAPSWILSPPSKSLFPSLSAKSLLSLILPSVILLTPTTLENGVTPTIGEVRSPSAITASR